MARKGESRNPSPARQTRDDKFRGCDRHHKIEFWTQLGFSPQSALQILVAVAAFVVAWKCKGAINRGEIKALKAQKQLAEDRLSNFAERSVGEAEAIAGLQVMLSVLQTRITASETNLEDRVSLRAIEPMVKDLVSRADKLATSHSTTTKSITRLLLQPGPTYTDSPWSATNLE